MCIGNSDPRLGIQVQIENNPCLAILIETLTSSTLTLVICQISVLTVKQ